MIAISTDQLRNVKTELKRLIFWFADGIVGANSLEKRRLKYCMEELMIQRDFWASVPPTLSIRTKHNILAQQNYRMLKILTQKALCPKCGSTDFMHERQPGRAITVHTLKKCNNCKTNFN